MKRVFACVVLFLAIQSAQAQPSSPANNDKFKLAESAYREKKFDEAARGFEQANKALGSHCYVCLLNAAYCYLQLGRRDEVLKLSAKALAIASTPEEQFTANLQRSELLLRVDPDEKELTEAELEAQKAVELQPASVAAHTALGMSLLHQGKDASGVAEIKWVDAHTPEGQEKKHLREIIADPRRARLVFAPEFTATTSDGKQVTLADMKGKVVLLDFWATWCPPCRASVSEIKELRKKYGADRLVVLSVSADNKQENWSEYITKHDMTWLQSWDRSNNPSLLHSFQVNSFPTYVLLDGEGIVRRRVNGLEPQQTLTARLRDMLDQLMK